MAARLPGLTALFLGLVQAGAALAAQEAVGTGPAARVITGETLRRAGALHLGDALLLAGGWHVSTVDGFAWDASPLGGSPFVPARWTVLVDGRRMELDLFGSTGLHRLAVPLERVDSVVLTELPRLEAGRLATHGIVHIHTAAPAAGASAGGWVTTGSEIGDPGPFGFTPRGGSNVDRIGHALSASLGYGAARWHAEGSFTESEMIPTDPTIAERYAAALGDRPRLELSGYAGRVGLRLGGGEHQLAARHSDVDRAYALAPLGAELPVRERFTRVGVLGRRPMGSERELSYEVGYSANRTRSQGDAAAPALDWDARATEARLELSQHFSRLETVGVSLRRVAVHSPEGLEDPDLGRAAVYAGFTLDRARRAAGAVTVSAGDGEIGWAALLRRGWVLPARSWLHAVLAFERTPTAEDNTVWAWADRGLPLPDESGAGTDIVGVPRASERLSADIVWEASPAAAVTVTARLLFRRERNLSLESRRLGLGPNGSFAGPTTVLHGQGGELGGVSGEAGARPVGPLTLRAALWYRRVLSGDPVYREAWRVVPRAGGRLTAEYVPVPGLELWLAGGYRGESRWDAYAGVEAESGGGSTAVVPDAFTLDVAVQKWLWDERLRAHLGVRNLTGTALRYHPAGATFEPSAVLQVEARLH